MGSAKVPQSWGFTCRAVSKQIATLLATNRDESVAFGSHERTAGKQQMLPTSKVIYGIVGAASD